MSSLQIVHFGENRLDFELTVSNAWVERGSADASYGDDFQTTVFRDGNADTCIFAHVGGISAMFDSIA